MFIYPAKIKSDGDIYVVSFRDFYGDEPVTQGASYEEALEMAADWLLCEASIALEGREKLPEATALREDEVAVEMPISAQAKLLLLYEMLDQSVSGSELARRMGINRPSVQNIIKAGHSTKIDTLDKALQVLGKRIKIELIPV